MVVAEFRSTFRHAVGGPDKTIFRSAAAHDPRRVRIVPLYLVPEGDPVPGVRALAEEAGVEPVLVPDRDRLGLRACGALAAALRDHGCHILHTHDFKTDFVGYRLAGARSGLRLMATAHGWSRPEEWKLRFYNWVDGKVLARFPLVVAVSRSVADRLAGAGVNPSRITVIPNGVDLDRWSRAAIPAGRPPGLPETPRVIGMVARLSGDKDLDTLLEAFGRVAERRDDVGLAVVGDGPERGRLESLAARHPHAGRIAVLGHRTDVLGLTASFSVAVLSTRAEGMPNAVLEAMALERPVVASRVGGVPELVEHERHGLLTPPGDAEALAAALLRLLDDPGEASRLARAARARVEERFSFAARLRRLETLYEERMGKITRTDSGSRASASHGGAGGRSEG